MEIRTEFLSVKYRQLMGWVKSGKLVIESISENLGHSKTSTTMNIYVQSDNETKKETANIIEEMLLDKQA